MAYGVLPTGFAKPALSDIQAAINAVTIRTFGNEVNNVAPSVIANLTGVFADREASLWDMGQGLYDSAYPDTASGVSLDNVVGINGIRRLAATFSKQQQVLLFGNAGTVVPKGTLLSVSGAPTSQFKTDFDSSPLVAGVNEVQLLLFSAVPTSGSFALSLFSQITSLISYNATAADVAVALNALAALGGGVSVTGSFAGGFVITFAGIDGLQPQPLLLVLSNTLTGSGAAPVGVTPSVVTPGVSQGVVTATAVNSGAVFAPALSLTVIDTPVAGLNTVLNYVDAIPGRAIETDQQLRIRRANTLQIGGNATIDAIRSKLLNLIGVTSVVPFENSTLLPDLAGRPAKSYEMVVVGGVDQDITQEIWNTKPGGIQTDGNKTGVAVDLSGNNQTVYWSRPISVPIYCVVNIVSNVDFPAGGAAVIAADVLAYGEALVTGQTVFVKTKLISSFSIVNGIEDVTVLLSTSPSPTIEQNIHIAANQIAVFDSTRIVVNVT